MVARRRRRSRAVARALLIDGNAFCYRAYYAIRALRTSTGRATNAVYGFITMLQALREKQRPAYLGVAFDVPKPTFRHERYAAYKAHRAPMPESLIEQLPTIRAYLAAARVPIFECAGYEADDVLATIAHQIAGPEVEVYIVTSDKDAMQLVGEHIKVYAPTPHDKVYDELAVVERFGVKPSQMIDLMSLMGDQTDNIPSVPGVGAKTARALMEQFGSVEHLLADVASVQNAALRHNLQSHEAQIALARELATVDRNVPMQVTVDAMAVREPDVDALRTLYRELEFRALLKKLGSAQTMVAAEALAALPEITDAQLATAAGCAQVACVPLMTSDTRPLSGLVVVWDTHAAYCPVVDGTAWTRLAPLWQGTPQLVVHHWKPVKRMLLAHHVTHTAPIFDTQVASYVLHPGQSQPLIEDVAEQYLQQAVTWESLPKDAEALQRQHAAVAVGRVLLDLAPRLQDALAAKALWSLYHEVERPLIDILAAMESEGIRLDVARLQLLRTQAERDIGELRTQILACVGHALNINSPKQLATVLFEELQLPVIKRTKTGASTDADTLQALARQHPLPAAIIRYRELAKLKSTYLDALPAAIDVRTGRLHTTLHQTVTATGRLSSSDPNLQNIPIRTEAGRLIRQAFVPRDEDGVLLSADYSQIELRILAHLSGDTALQHAFAEERDVHRYTASLIYGTSEADVTTEMRGVAKTVNFGVIYGMEAHGLARELHIDRKEAQAFIDAYFERYPGVATFAETQVAQAKSQGYVMTLLGRRRYIPELQSGQGSVRQFGERVAVNAPIQGTAADLIKVAMIRVAQRLHTMNGAARMVLQVHDDLLFDAPCHEVDALVQMLRQEMTSAMTLDVPLVVTFKAGPNWADLVPVDAT